MDEETTCAWQNIKLMTVSEVATWMRVSPKTVYRWIAEKRISAVNVGVRTYRIPEQEILRLLEETGMKHLLDDLKHGSSAVR